MSEPNNENNNNERKHRLIRFFLKDRNKSKPSTFQGGLVSYTPPVPVIKRRRIKIKTTNGDGGSITSSMNMENRLNQQTQQEEVEEEVIEEEEGEDLRQQKDIELMNAKERRKLLKAKWNHFLGLNDNFSSIWMACLMEFIGTNVFTFMSIAITVASVNYFDIDPQVPGSVGNYKIFCTIGVLHLVLLFLLIMSVGPSSGAHLNSTITLATLFTGYTSVIRATMYIIAQISGGVVGAAILRGILPFSIIKKTNLGMCIYGNEISPGGAIGAEYMFSLLSLIVAFGTAINAKARAALGPMTGAFFVALALCLSIIITGGMANVYTFGFNISRCLAPAIIMGNFTMMYPFIVGPVLACMCTGVWVFSYPENRYFSNFQYIESVEGWNNRPKKKKKTQENNDKDNGNGNVSIEMNQLPK